MAALSYSSNVTVHPRLIAVSGVDDSDLYFVDDSSNRHADHYIGRLSIHNRILHGPVHVVRNVSGITALAVTDETVQNGKRALLIIHWCINMFILVCF